MYHDSFQFCKSSSSSRSVFTYILDVLDGLIWPLLFVCLFLNLLRNFVTCCTFGISSPYRIVSRGGEFLLGKQVLLVHNRSHYSLEVSVLLEYGSDLLPTRTETLNTWCPIAQYTVCLLEQVPSVVAIAHKLILCITSDYSDICINPYPTAFPYGNGMVLHFYQQQESSTNKTVHKVINKGLKAYV